MHELQITDATSGRRTSSGLVLRALVGAIVACTFLVFAAAASAAPCFSNPSSCGYPDATNTGVPPGTTLTASGSRTLSQNGQVLEGVDLTGSVTVTADNVTIRNSKLHTNSGGSGSTVITLNNGADNFTLEDSEVYGNGSKTNAPESGVWNHYNNPGARVIRSYIHGSPDNWEGRVDLVKDSYMIVDAEYSGAHSENIYICGQNATVEHSTLYNESDETALIFGDGICGGGNTVSVTDSLLAGGGFMLEPNAKGVSAPVTITNNRVGRCLTSSHQDSGGGYVCSSGADSNGYWPRGGHYGISADLGNSATWSGNVWDDNGQAVCASGSAGCAGTGGGTPPPDIPADGVWTAPSGVIAGTPVTLSGSASTGDAPLACTWTLETQGGTVLDTKTGCQVSYTFQNSGTQYMRLTVADVDGDRDSNRQTISVAAPSSPPPDIPADAVWTAPSGVIAGTPVTLSGSASTGDAPLACTWTLETQGGTVLDTKTGCQVSYTFQNSGTQYMRLTVADVDGDRDSSRKKISVSAPNLARHGKRPSPEVTASPTVTPRTPVSAIWSAPDPRVGGTATFDATGSQGTQPITCVWKFESRDGSKIGPPREGCRVRRRFRKPGVVYATLTVKAADGSSATSRRAVRVRPRQKSARSSIYGRLELGRLGTRVAVG